ncbi:MAG: hypothetical protein RL376_147 [Verrucomicrobiota bacterium]|jgi:arylsulfatase A-like enzyme
MSSAPRPAVAAPPDILWIVTTQWRAQACGYAGDPNARTPALDALARDSRTVNYAQAVTPHPFGPFARAALLTGMPSPQNGMRDYWDALPADARTVAHDLATRGYRTAFFGKWGVGVRDRAAPLVSPAAAQILVPPGARGGFAHWVGFEGGFQLNHPWLHGDGIGDGVTPQQLHGYQSDVLAACTADWLARPASGPRFTVLSLEAPHPPYAAATPTDGYTPRSEALILPANVPRGGEIEAQARRELAGYYTHLAATDAAIGRLLACVTPATIVVFTSVHGDMHGAHGLFRKGWPHEESIRVPLLVRGVKELGARKSDEPVSLLDLPAMAREWSEGREWICERDRAEISMPCVVALPHQCDRIWRGWRSATEKHLWTLDGGEWSLPEERA